MLVVCRIGLAWWAGGVCVGKEGTMIKMEALIGNGVTAQKKLVNTGKRKVLTPGEREKNKKKMAGTTVAKEKIAPAGTSYYYLLFKSEREKKSREMAGKEQMHREKSNKNQSQEISEWLAIVVGLLPF